MAYEGAAYVFITDNDGITWTQEQKLVPSDGASTDRFGECLAMYSNVLVIGANRHGGYGLCYGSKSINEILLTFNT